MPAAPCNRSSRKAPIIVRLRRSAAFAGLATTFAVVMIGTTIPTPMYAR